MDIFSSVDKNKMKERKKILEVWTGILFHMKKFMVYRSLLNNSEHIQNVQIKKLTPYFLISNTQKLSKNVTELQLKFAETVFARIETQVQTIKYKIKTRESE